MVGAASVACVVCGAGGSIRPLRAMPGWSQCKQCGLVVNDVDPPEDYDEDYFTEERSDSSHRNFGSSWARRYDETRFGAELALLERRTSGRSVLDVGAATGSFLDIARGRGWGAEGVEHSASARAIAARSGLRVAADLDGLARSTYDVITLHHVLEHMHDPVEGLRALVPFLAPSGFVLVEVPNWQSVERWSAGASWVDLRPDQHRWHFTPRSLRTAVTRAGLAVQQELTLGDPLPGRETLLDAIGVGRLRRRRQVEQKPTGDAQQPHQLSADRINPLVRRAASVIDRAESVVRVGKRLVVMAAAAQAD